MATLKRCDACGEVVAGFDYCEHCHADLTRSGAVRMSSASVRTSGRKCSHDDCGADGIDPDASACPYCNRSLGGQSLDAGGKTLELGTVRFGLADGESVVLGRDATVSPLHGELASYPNVSRRHAEIRAGTGATVVVRDLGSTNGTFVNGERVSEAPVRLQDGDVIGLGATARLTVRIDGIPP